MTSHFRVTNSKGGNDVIDEDFDHDIEIESEAGVPLSKYNFEQWPNVDTLDTQIDMLRDRIEGLRVMHFSRWHHLRITPKAIFVYEMDGGPYTALIETEHGGQIIHQN